MKWQSLDNTLENNLNINVLFSNSLFQWVDWFHNPLSYRNADGDEDEDENVEEADCGSVTEKHQFPRSCSKLSFHKHSANCIGMRDRQSAASTSTLKQSTVDPFHRRFRRIALSYLLPDEDHSSPSKNHHLSDSKRTHSDLESSCETITISLCPANRLNWRATRMEYIVNLN